MNFQKEMEILLAKEEICGKKLFLHSCCAPCSSYVLEYLKNYFEITVFYFNPNISEEPEYRKRVEEQIKLIEAFNRDLAGFPIHVEEGDYEPSQFFCAVKGYETCQEGGERCKICFQLRLEETARRGEAGGFDYFATTLTLSPLKNAPLINEIGEAAAQGKKITYLASDFKKKNGYKRSIELSKEYELYRQDYCGCIFSKRDRKDKE